MAHVAINDLLAKALDTNDLKLLRSTTDYCRRHGENYNAILQRVQKIRPAMTEAEWDQLLYDADEAED